VLLKLCDYKDRHCIYYISGLILESETPQQVAEVTCIAGWCERSRGIIVQRKFNRLRNEDLRVMHRSVVLDGPRRFRWL